ncbi:MAG: hydrolase [Bacteroidetes bacterium HGW-Bacteroidetes-6]|jgi:putative nucleotidyltransferase with HDIG domain|nr:MAG: hydrolase [Bacteroidetes bacterium HGW-Bacteroidetes-6]
MTRTSALALLDKYIQNPKMKAHCLASEAVMRALARQFGEDEEIWGLAGLLHDIDVEVTNADALTHGQVCIALLREEGLTEEAIEAISLHNEMSAPKPRSTRFHYALAAGETITGLIFATALVYPDKKISSVKPKSVIKRMKEKHFAASVKRENIMECEMTGLSLESFVFIALEAMVKIESELL